jgi:hypothetical protein
MVLSRRLAGWVRPAYRRRFDTLVGHCDAESSTKGRDVSDTDPDGTPVEPVRQTPPPYAAPPSAYPYPGQGAAPQAAPPAYGAPSAYGAAPAYYAGYAGPKTNVLAIISMIASIVGFVWILPFIGSLAGVIMGHISLRQIARTGEKGRGMALAGLIVGYVGLAFFVIGIAFFLFFVFAVAASEGTRYSS